MRCFLQLYVRDRRYKKLLNFIDIRSITKINTPSPQDHNHLCLEEFILKKY